MRQFIFPLSAAVILLSCNDKATTSASTRTTTDSSASTAPSDLPYTASYSSSWSDDVSDGDLKTVLSTYKNWADNNMNGLSNAMADTVEVDFTSGERFKNSNAELMKRWSSFRDSLSSVTIDMQGWRKMYSTDKKDGYIITWYKEVDTFKDGKADSADYHDINQVKDGRSFGILNTKDQENS